MLDRVTTCAKAFGCMPGTWSMARYPGVGVTDRELEREVGRDRVDEHAGGCAPQLAAA